MQSRSIVRLTASVVTIPANSAGRENRTGPFFPKIQKLHFTEFLV